MKSVWHEEVSVHEVTGEQGRGSISQTSVSPIISEVKSLAYSVDGGLPIQGCARTYIICFLFLQHVVDRNLILRRSKRFWVRLFGFLMRETVPSYYSARVLENTWSFILEGKTNVPAIPMCDMLRCD